MSNPKILSKLFKAPN